MMLNFSKYFGDNVEAWFTDAGTDFILPDSGEIFGNRQRKTLSEIGIDAGHVRNIRQVHGGRVLKVGEEDRCSLSEMLKEADGMITDVPGLVLAVRTADCVPVFLYDPVRNVVGLIHAGWKSAEQRILSVAVAMMCEMFKTDAEDIRAVFGPSIHACCYQVGQDFGKVFSDEVKQKDGKWFLNLQAVNRRQLLGSGIRDEHIFDCGICTCCDENYFSYRRQADRAGRHISLFGIKDER